MARALLCDASVLPSSSSARKYPGRSLSPSDFWPVAVAWVAVFSTACSGGPAADGDAGGAPVDSGSAAIDGSSTSADAGSGDGPGFVPNRVGHINIIEGSPFWENGFGLDSLEADLNDAPWVPRAQELLRAGDCAMYSHSGPGFCEPACTDQFCAADGQCVPFPTRVSAGDIEIAGMLFPFAFEVTGDGYTFPFNDIPKADFFADDAVLTASAPGDEMAAFSLTASGVPPLATSMVGDFIYMTEGQQHTFTWTGEDSGKVQIAVRRGWHGEPYTALILCEVADTGQYTLPTAMVEKFNELTGAEHVDYWWLARFNRDVVDAEYGQIELFVGSMVFRYQLD